MGAFLHDIRQSFDVFGPMLHDITGHLFNDTTWNCAIPKGFPALSLNILRQPIYIAVLSNKVHTCKRFSMSS
jgi:hypothetical protein